MSYSPSFPSRYLRHSSFSNRSIASPTSQLILQPFLCFTYVTANSPTLLSLLLRHRLFTYVTWRAAHAPVNLCINSFCTLCILTYHNFNRSNEREQLKRERAGKLHMSGYQAHPWPEKLQLKS